MLNNIQKIWNDFASRPFPPDCSGMEIEGIELGSLDTSAAGCINTFVCNDGRLDADRISALEKCTEEIDAVVPMLDGEAMDYFEELRLVSNEVLRLVSRG